MRKGDLLRRVSNFGSPIEWFPEVAVGPYVFVSGPKEGIVKVTNLNTRLGMVIDVYFEGGLLKNQPLQDFKPFSE